MLPPETPVKTAAIAIMALTIERRTVQRRPPLKSVGRREIKRPMLGVFRTIGPGHKGVWLLIKNVAGRGRGLFPVDTIAKSGEVLARVPVHSLYRNKRAAERARLALWAQFDNRAHHTPWKVGTGQRVAVVEGEQIVNRANFPDRVIGEKPNAKLHLRLRRGRRSQQRKLHLRPRPGRRSPNNGGVGNPNDYCVELVSTKKIDDGEEILVAMGMPLQRELAAQRAAAAAAAAARTTNPTAAAYGAKIVAMQRGANGRFKTISIGKRKRIHQLNQKKKKVLRRGDNGKFC